LANITFGLPGAAVVSGISISSHIKMGTLIVFKFVACQQQQHVGMLQRRFSNQFICLAGDLMVLFWLHTPYATDTSLGTSCLSQVDEIVEPENNR